MNNKFSITLLLAFALAGGVFNNTESLKAQAAEDYPELLPSSSSNKPVSQESSSEAASVKNIMNLTPVSDAKKADDKDLDEVTNQNLDKKALEKKLKQEKKQAKKDQKEAEKSAKQEAKQEAKTKAAVNKTDKTAKDEASKSSDTKAQKEDKNEISARELKRIEKKKEQYKDYLIPTDSYMPVGNVEDRSTKITGSIQKTLEFNLADCLELALINHPRIKAAYANASAQKAVKNQTLSNYSPRVNIDAGISRVKPDKVGGQRS